jgi:hypothetical protein
LTDYSQVDTLGSRYTPGNFPAPKRPGSPTRFSQIDRGRATTAKPHPTLIRRLLDSMGIGALLGRNPSQPTDKVGSGFAEVEWEAGGSLGVGVLYRLVREGEGGVGGCVEQPRAIEEVLR